jgi:hypothetical protein
MKMAAVEKTEKAGPWFELTRGLPEADLETLTVEAIRTHRLLIDKAEQLFQALPDDYKTGEATGGAQHLEYIRACMDMHAQMDVLDRLINVLGHVPKEPVH